MNISIIGVSAEGGLGNHLAEKFRDEGHQVRVARRGDVFDLDADVIILSLFDHKNPPMQETVFKGLFNRVKDTGKQLVVIGSTVHHFHDTDYAKAKRNLKDSFYELGKNTLEYGCRLLLVEPGALELIGKQPTKVSHLLFSEICDIISSLIKINPKFMHVAVRGEHAPIPH